MGKIQEIADGWSNLAKKKFGLLSKEVLDMERERLYHCNRCHLKVQGICSKAKKGFSEKTKKLENGCGCPVKAKVLSPKTFCPLGKWGSKIIKD
jgi:hypothetical protein